MNDAARDNGYKYNGKELNEDWGLGWYDYGARWYMPDLGRWGAVDPLAEDYTPLNPYNYVADNPIINYDPDGEFIGTIIGGIIGGVTAAIRGENVFKGIVSGAAAGAVADLVIATGGTGLVALAVAGAASGAAGNYVDQRLNGVSHEDVSWKNVGISAALGGSLGYLGGKINLGPSLGRAQGWLGRQFSRAFARKGEFEVGEITSTIIDNGSNIAGSGTPRLKSTARLRKEWKEIHKEPWPKDPLTGENYIAHHRNALADGGIDHGANIDPLSKKDHINLHKERGDFKRFAQRRNKKKN
jgi:RHS repeat-associated protein